MDQHLYLFETKHLAHFLKLVCWWFGFKFCPSDFLATTVHLFSCLPSENYGNLMRSYPILREKADIFVHSTEYWVKLKMWNIPSNSNIGFRPQSVHASHLPFWQLGGPQQWEVGGTKVGGGREAQKPFLGKQTQRVPHVTAGVYSTHFIHPLPEIPSTNDFIYSTNFVPFLSKFTAGAQRGAFFGDGPCGLCGK